MSKSHQLPKPSHGGSGGPSRARRGGGDGDTEEAHTQDTLGNAAVLNLMRAEPSVEGDAGEAFGEATSGAAGQLPYLGELESAFGADLSEVEAYLGEDDALDELGAHGAALDEQVALESGASKETVGHEVAHVMQARDGGGADGPQLEQEVGAADSPAEQQAEEAGSAFAAGESLAGMDFGSAGAGTVHLDSNPLASDTSSDDVEDANAAQGALEVTPEEKASQLRAAIRTADTRTIYLLLGGDNSAVKAAFETAYGQSVSAYVMDAMSYEHWTHVLSFVRFGKADVESRVKAVTWDILGTDEKALYHILETASFEERYEMANNQVILFYITNDTSGATKRRCLAALEPLMTSGVLDDAAKTALFEAVKAMEEELGAQVQTLITRLEARKGFWNDDEAGMLTDVEEWVKARGSGFPDLDLEKREPGELMPAIDWLEGELSSREFTQAVNTLRTGGQRGLMDKIEEAGADTTWWWSNVDESGIYAAISAASPEERQAILNDPEQLAQVMALLDEGTEQERVKKLLAGQATGESASAYEDLLEELDGWLYVSDVKVFSCLDRMTPEDLVRIRRDDTLRTKIEGGISDVPRFHATVGYTGEASESGSSNQSGLSEDIKQDLRASEETAGGELAKSNERVIALIEEAVDHWDDNEDKIYKSVIAWQDAGGKMDRVADAALLDRAQTALLDVDNARWEEIYFALTGSRRLTWQDRLESAVVGAGTDDTGLDATIKEVPDDVLVREWSNLDEYRTKAEAAKSQTEVEALAHFVVDVDTGVQAMIKGDRDDWLELVGQLRDKMVEALEKPDVAKIAEGEFHYVVREELLARLQYAQAAAFAEHDRGPGFWNNISMGLMDTGSATGTTTEREFGEYQGAMEEVVSTEEGTAEHDEALAGAEQQRKEYIESHEDYTAAKASAASIAGAIVGVIVSTLVTIATAGTAGPAAVALMSGMCGAVFTELTEAAIQGNDYSVEKGAEDLTVALVGSVMTLGLGSVTQKMAAGIGGTEAATAFSALLKDQFGDTFALWAQAAGKDALKSAFATFPKTYATDLIRTEGLLRQELLGVEGALKSTVKTYAVGLVTKAITFQVDDRAEDLAALKAMGDWDEYASELLKKKLVDLAIVTTVSKVWAGKPLTYKDWITLMCKVAVTRNGVKLDAKAAQEDAGKSLAFFNTATAEELKRVKGIGDGIATRILTARAAGGGFQNLQGVYDVPYFKEDVLMPAATEIRDDFLKQKEAEQSASAAPS